MTASYLPAGTGYYRLNRHPLGSDYQRSPQDPEIVSIERHLAATTPAGYKSLHGCNAIVQLCNGDRAAIDLSLAMQRDSVQ